MAELVQIRARAKSAEPEPEGTAAPGARRRLRGAVRNALQVAASVLPSRDPTKNGREKLALLLGVGVPGGWLVLWKAVKLASDTNFLSWHLVSDTTLVAGGAVAAFVLPFVVAWLATFVFTLAFTIATRRSQSRVQQALVCPYCRDQVAQDGTVVCARPGCAALYHRECWDECAVQYGGCAIYGCSSKKSREISAVGFVLRLSRLVLAALLFPPRMARALRDRGGDELAPVLRRSFDGAKIWHRTTNERSSRQLWIVAAGFVAVLIAIISLRGAIEHSRMSENKIAFLTFGAFYAVPFGLLALPFVVAILTLPVYFTIRAITTVFKNELAALGRADEGGGSVLGRLRSGLGGKKECC